VRPRGGDFTTVNGATIRPTGADLCTTSECFSVSVLSVYIDFSVMHYGDETRLLTLVVVGVA